MVCHFIQISVECALTHFHFQQNIVHAFSIHDPRSQIHVSKSLANSVSNHPRWIWFFSRQISTPTHMIPDNDLYKASKSVLLVIYNDKHDHTSPFLYNFPAINRESSSCSHRLIRYGHMHADQCVCIRSPASSLLSQSNRKDLFEKNTLLQT